MHGSKGTVAAGFQGFSAALGQLPRPLAGLLFSAFLILAPPAHASDPQSVSLALENPHAGNSDIAALRDYARHIGLEQSGPVADSAAVAHSGAVADSGAVANNVSPHPHFGNADFTALREYARDVGIAQPPTAMGDPDWVHPHLGVQLASLPTTSAAAERSDPEANPHISGHVDDPELAALRDYAQDIAGDSSAPVDTTIKLAADNAFDAFREMLRKQGQPTPSPHAVPDTGPLRPVPPAARRDPSFIDAHRMGSQTCLYCHAVQAEAFGHTLMGRISKTQPGKFDCENCHGPGSAHVQAVGCSACHGEGGITRRPGIPSLTGQDPQYLTQAMRAYVTGKRRHDLMRLVVSGLGEGEIHNIAAYYARQPAEQAKTPPVGDASAGRTATALCAGCHGELGISTSPAWWPSLAGQDAQYLADAIGAYKSGTRSKSIACAGCHGEGGISRKPGIPSLAGMGQQYLVTAMKDYASGERKHGVMRALLSGVDDGQLNSFALFYSRQSLTRAQTPALGNPSAGKAAAALCTGCHGESEGSVSNAIPALAGQDARYLSAAIKAYRDGTRHKIVACAFCHGERGISKKPGTPSLAGLASPYLVAAMKSYAAGQRKHAVMHAILTDVGDPELNDIAKFYAGQLPTRAETPPLGDPAAGKTASAACAGCHGPLGISANPVWPSLAGQNARYLADALKAYKDGSRDNAMMKGMAAALDQTAINNIATYYASLAPAQPPGSPQAPAPAASREPTLPINKLLAPLDDRTADDIAGYFAGLVPARAGQPAQDPTGGREPVVVRNGLVASLDERTARNVASYYASLAPEHPRDAGRTAGGPVPALVSYSRPADGSSPGGIVSFRKNDPSRKADLNNAICLGCHERGDRTYWRGSTHENRAVACTECHTVMRPISRKAALKTEIEMDTCFQCHKDRRAQILRSSHMPLREGKITCSNCHNPHGSTTEALLKENSINDTCYKCHAEKRGPFLFEHAPVRENCLSCHDPHGSNNEYMLKISRPRLCAECHGIGHGSVTNGPKTVETFGRACQNCHTAIHGSNSPSGALLQR
jgi:DmsE family decaheme c-type cytochrome